MKIKFPQVSLQPKFWGLTGPLFITVTSFIVLFKASTTAPSWQLPLAALVGLVFTYIWAWRGALTGIALLLAISVYHLVGHSLENFIWVSTLALSLVTALIVTGLTLEESQLEWDLLSKGLDGERKTIRNLSESFQAAQSHFHSERQQMLAKLEESEKAIRKAQEQQLSTEHTVEIVREELTALHARQETLLQELFESRQEAAANADRFMERPAPERSNPQLLEELEKLASQLQEQERLVAEYKSKEEVLLIEQRLARQQIKTDTDEIAALKELLHAAENQVALSIEKQKQLEQASQESIAQLSVTGKERELLERTITRLQSEMESVVAEFAAKQTQHQTLQEELANAQSKLLELQNQATPANAYELSRVQGLYNQLREQFEQKSQVLDQTRQELFLAQEKILSYQKELEELSVGENSEVTQAVKDLLLTHEKEVDEIKAMYEDEITSLQEIIATLSQEKAMR